MSNEMTIRWKWKIGDAVTHAAFDPCAVQAIEQKLYVVGRLAEECPGGGVQKSYRVCALRADWVSGQSFSYTLPVGTYQIHEEELRDLTPPRAITTANAKEGADKYCG